MKKFKVSSIMGEECSICGSRKLKLSLAGIPQVSCIPSCQNIKTLGTQHFGENHGHIFIEIQFDENGCFGHWRPRPFTEIFRQTISPNLCYSPTGTENDFLFFVRAIKDRNRVLANTVVKKIMQ